MKRLVLLLAFINCVVFPSKDLFGVPSQRTFNSPEEAVKALEDAVARSSRADLTNLFGTKFMKEIDTGDEKSEKSHLLALKSLMDQGSTIVASGSPSGRIVQFGRSNWPFPAPITERNGKWFFNTYIGAEEIKNRRIGENELRAIKVARFFVEAQKLYQSKVRDGQSVRSYASRMISNPGRKDGLYWPMTTNDEPSPFGPLIGRATREGYGVGAKKKRGEDSLYHGYYYRVLTSQGADAPGGAKSYYSKEGLLTEGVALLAYPSRWGVSGIASFIVGVDGVVYERDLGPETFRIAKGIASFNPDKSWDRVQD